MEGMSEEALRRRIDELMEKAMERAKPDPYETALVDFLGKHLNTVLAFGILKKYKEQGGIDSLGRIDSRKRIAFADRLIGKVFSRIRDPGQIAGMKEDLRRLMK